MGCCITEGFREGIRRNICGIRRDICGDHSSKTSFYCTRPKDHLGDHIACGGTGKGKQHHRIAQWSQEGIS